MVSKPPAPPSQGGWSARGRTKENERSKGLANNGFAVGFASSLFPLRLFLCLLTAPFPRPRARARFLLHFLPLLICLLLLMADLASARAYLRASPASGGVSVQAHLQALLLRIVQEKPKEPLKQFEALSVQIKQERLREATKAADAAAAAAASSSSSSATTAPSPSSSPSSSQQPLGVLGVDVSHPPLFSSAESKAALQAYLQRAQDRLKRPKRLNADGEEEEPEEEPEANPQAPDMQQEAFMLQQAGQTITNRREQGEAWEQREQRAESFVRSCV